MASRRPSVKRTPKLNCPFTGKPLEIVQMGNGHWIARGDFWQTKMFDLKEWLEWQLSFRDGVAPNFPKSRVAVTGVREPTPANPLEDLIAAHKAGEAASKAIAKEVGLPHDG